jgi:hypothetical protein
MGTWIARVEWRTPDTYDEPALDLVMEHLAGHDPALARESGPYATLEVWSATVTITGANTLRKATAAALELVEGATGEKAVGIEVLPVEVHDHRVEQPTIPELVGYAEIAEMLGVTRQRASQLADAVGFPAAVIETRAGPLRVRSQVEHWAATWERKGGRPRKVVAPEG